MKTPVIPSLVDVQKHVGVNLLVLRLLLPIETVGGIFSKLGVGGGIELLGVFVLRVVDLHASGKGHPVRDVVVETRAEVVAVLLVLAKVAVVDPVRVLHRHSGVADRPVLSVDLA